jgi:hypothetical protein
LRGTGRRGDDDAVSAERSDCGCDSEVILDVVFERGLLFLVVANIGNRPAREVRIRFRRAFSGLGGTRKMHKLALFGRLEFLAPHKSIEVFLDRSASYFARGEPTELTATIAWRTGDGEPRRATVHHDLEIYRDLAYIEREVPARAGEA